MSIRAVDGACKTCGEDDFRVIKEYHHIYGRNNDPEIIILCHNCHDKVTYDQNSSFSSMDRSKNANKKAKKAVEDVSIGSLLEIIGTHLKRRGKKHGNRSKSL
jgi:hypothetical protein